MSSLPFSAEAEAGFIARLLVDPGLIPTLVGTVESSDFHDETLGKAWDVMIANAGNARRFDITVLKSQGIDLGDALSFMQQGQAPAVEYATIIRTDAVKRRAMLALKAAERKVRSSPDERSVVDAVQDAARSVIEEQRGTGSLMRLSDAAAEYQPKVGGFPWGIKALDDVLQPVEPGLVILAARPSVGKTALAMDMALSWSKHSPDPVLFASVEMSKRQLLRRLDKRVGGLASLADHNLYILDESRITSTTVRSNAMRLRTQYGSVKAIVVDYLQLLSDPGEPEVIRVARISRELKAVSREFSCPMLALSQLSRASENRDDTRPRLSDLRDSGAIEQDADIVFGGWRRKKDSEEFELLFLKNREGPAGGSITLKFDLARVSVGGD